MTESQWTIGDVVRKLRASAHLKLKELADRAGGMNISVIHNLETGRTKEAERETLNRIASTFGLTVRELEDLVPQQPVRWELASAHQNKPHAFRRELDSFKKSISDREAKESKKSNVRRAITGVGKRKDKMS